MSHEMTRRLVAIVAADVVGFSRLVEQDELKTISELQAIQSEIIRPLTQARGGRLFKSMGDGFLFEFPSAVHAVEAALALQQEMATRDQKIVFRIGIHVGDVLVDGDDLLGDGINITARIEGLSPAGGISLSDDAYRQVADKLAVRWTDTGEQKLKNITRAVRVWNWSANKGTSPETQASFIAEILKPSIAVLPFDNLSNDPEQDFFADGMVEDMIMALSRCSQLFVTSRSSSFFYKGQPKDLSTCARELGVRYVLEGSVRRAGQRLRVSAQLTEATSNKTVWGDRFDRDVSDLFDIQDEITQNVVGIVSTEIARLETHNAAKRRVNDLSAWERLMKAVWHGRRHLKHDNLLAQEIIQQEIADGHDSAIARAYLGLFLAIDLSWGFSGRTPMELLPLAFQSAMSAVAQDPNDEIARALMSAVCWMAGDHNKAISEAELAVQLNANSNLGHIALGYAHAFSGPDHLEASMLSLTRAIRIGPRDDETPQIHAFMGVAHFVAGDCATAEQHCLKALELDPAQRSPARVLASIMGHTGRIQEGAEMWVRATEKVFDLEAYKQTLFRLYKRREDAERILDGLRLVGVAV